ncbi:MAG: SAF domain-containing protein [Acidimicrobiia bacterium]|nr:SAF domain-containing protein [Acidimicrobiia bacterium]
MYWLGSPAYLRWLAAGLIIAGALFVEFRPTHKVDHPFAAEAMHRGEPLSAVVWRPAPSDLLPMPDLDGSFAAVDIAKGEPLLPSHVSGAGYIPPNWWSIPVAMPFAAPIGTSVQLVDGTTRQLIEGVIVAQPSDDPFAIDPAALIAVPPDSAAAFAVAAATGQVTVLIASR